MRAARHLLWVDCAAAATAGVLMLLLGPWLSEVYRLPRGLLLFIGVTNLLYASYSFTLALRGKRPRLLLYGLVAGNALWAGACVVMAVQFAGAASLFAQIHLVGEALFVGGLAACEWRWREQILHCRG
ncbi:hypothetical protein DMO17_13865 [Aquipseudomonas alcaligenes]|uniref:Uncharacterized protein n=2 Tax=Aquipseudomonas alcaligenes TaxID=43263 RepID=A0A2V4KWJ5_AQUAC|nr:hypothetical protein DMO17_13865 [Pseudomonas alcaligenes]